MSVLAISNGTLAVIIAVVLADIFLIAFLISYSRRARAARRAASGELPPAPAKAVSRRDFQRRALLTSVMLFGAEFGLGSIGFLWPNLKGGFGSQINAGALSEIKSEIQTSNYVYVGAARTYLVGWNGTPGTNSADYPGEGVTAEGRHVAVPALCAPRLPRPVLQLVEVVRMPVPRLEVQQRR